MPDQEQPLKEATIKVLKIKEDKWNDRPVWRIIDEKGEEWSLWNKELREHIKEGESYPVKYSEKLNAKGELQKSIQRIVGVELKGKGGWGGGGSRLTFAEEMEKQRVIAAQCVFKTFKEKGEWTLTPDETMTWIMGKGPHNPATKPQEGKITPSCATRDKPPEAPPAQGAKTATQLYKEAYELQGGFTPKAKTDLIKFAKEQGWENGESIVQDGLKAIARDKTCLSQWIAYLMTEKAKTK